jgi:hypothetical protein
MAKIFEKLIFGGLHEKHAVQRGIFMQHPYESVLPIIFNNFLANLLGFSLSFI